MQFGRASGGDLDIQDGRCRLIEVVGWPGWKPAIPLPSAQGKPSEWADGDGMTSRSRRARLRRKTGIRSRRL
jgi:hypothetical protein